MSAALAAASNGIDTIILEAHAAAETRDARVLALSYGTRLILQRLGVWAYLSASQPIRTVHVSETGVFGATTLSADVLGLQALGYVVAQTDLVQALRRRVCDMGIECVAGARVLDVVQTRESAAVRYELDGRTEEIEVSVVAAAEGGATLAPRTDVTEREYHQHALIATLTAERAADDCAYERFTAKGPIALLPMGGMHALIWTVPAADADVLLTLNDTEFEYALSERYGRRIGAVKLQGPRASFALKLRFARNITSGRLVLVGNSAQTLHPIAGQGFNLGLRDAYEFAAALGYCKSHGRDLVQGIRKYRLTRRLDRVGGTLFTDLLVRAFSNDHPIIALGRSAALAGLDACEPAKKFLLRRLIFGAPR
jgi:2-octaprenyl-6-methoxyphenol hydroxylase